MSSVHFLGIVRFLGGLPISLLMSHDLCSVTLHKHAQATLQESRGGVCPTVYFSPWGVPVTHYWLNCDKGLTFLTWVIYLYFLHRMQVLYSASICM